AFCAGLRRPRLEGGRGRTDRGRLGRRLVHGRGGAAKARAPARYAAADEGGAGLIPAPRSFGRYGFGNARGEEWWCAIRHSVPRFVTSMVKREGDGVGVPSFIRVNS